MTTHTPERSQKIRAITPDIARGIALLGIALANLPTAWAVTSSADYAGFFGGVFGPGSVFDDIAVVFAAMFLHVRGLAMFTTLLGFGVGLIVMSLWRKHYPLKDARRVLWRRYGLLALIGLLHLVFLFFGDIMVAYGLGAMVLIAMISLKDRTLMIVAWVMLGIQMAFSIGSSIAALLYPEMFSYDLDMLGENYSYSEYLLTNLLVGGVQLLAAPFIVFTLLPLMIIGMVWARKGVLSNIDEHITILRAWVVVAAAVILIVGLPWGLSSIGVLSAELVPFFNMLNTGLGMLTGPGILAALALSCRGLQQRIDAARSRGEDFPLPLPIRALAALGKRSMSGYILQSIFFIIVTQPFMLGWGRDVGIIAQMGIALGVWFATLALAFVWELAGWPGPFESVHRRLAYGRDGLKNPPIPQRG